MSAKNNIGELEARLGYVFRDKALLMQALTRTSYVNEHRKGGCQSNEVLEFYGDSILSAAIVTLFMNEYTERVDSGIRTKWAEGELTVIRSKLSDKKNLSERAREIGIGKYLRMGEGDSKLGIADEPSVLEDALESIIGAIYIDSGMNMPRVISVVSGILDVKGFLSAKAVESDAVKKSAKNRLQEFCADKKHRLPPPVYKTVGESGPEHKKIYLRECSIGGKKYAVGEGKNLKLADADAAEKTLVILAGEHTRVKKKEEKASKKEAESYTAESIVALREYARSNKLTVPSYKDMGETDRSTPALREYAVRCNFHGKESLGVGADKSIARAISAGKMLESVKGMNKSKKAPKSAPRVKKNATKTTRRKG